MVQLQVASMFFFSGLAVILALVVFVYVIAWIYDRASGSDRALLSPAELEERCVVSSLVRDAGLAGLLSHEINSVTHHFFEESSYPYVKEGGNEGAFARTKENKDAEIFMHPGTSRIEGSATVSIAIESGNAIDDYNIDDETLKASERKRGSDEEAELTNEEERIDTEDSDERTIAEMDIEATKYDTHGDIDSRAKSTVETHGNSHAAVDHNLNAGPIQMSLSDLPLSYSIKHLLILDGNKGDSEASVEEDHASDSINVEPLKGRTSLSQQEEEDEVRLCPICLCEYDEGEKVVLGSSCGHMYHSECFMQWMEKSHNECPFCRADMMSSDEFLATAYEVLGEKRVDKLRYINEAAARRLAAWNEKESQGSVQASLQSQPVAINNINSSARTATAS